MKRIAILSNDPIMSRFFELEATAWGFSVSCFDKLHSINDEYDFVITDRKYFSSAVNKFSCKIGVIIRDGESNQDQFSESMLDSICIAWPPSIKDLKNVLCNIESAEVTANTLFKNTSGVISYYEKEPCIIWYMDKKIILTQAEAKLLHLLCSSCGSVVSKKEINSLFEAEKGNIGEVYIHHLRKKLEEPFSTKIIHTVRANGYRIDVKLHKI